MTRLYADMRYPRPAPWTWVDTVIVAVGSFAVLFAFAVIFILFLLTTSPATHARDLGQWQNESTQLRRWFEGLRQPDDPKISCCGEADAYWADGVEVKDGQTIAIITDDRPDEPLGRPHVDVGTRIVVPPNKLKWDAGNPTGHVVIFLSFDRRVYCYVQNGGT